MLFAVQTGIRPVPVSGWDSLQMEDVLDRDSQSSEGKFFGGREVETRWYGNTQCAGPVSGCVDALVAVRRFQDSYTVCRGTH